MTLSIRTCLLLACALALSGCANWNDVAPSSARMLTPTMQRTDTPEPDAFVQSIPEASASAWWRAFADPALDALIEQALGQAPSVRLAAARVAKAEALFSVAGAAHLPSVGAGLDLSRQKFTANGAVPPPLAGAILDSGTLQASASWEPDFFGKHAAALRAALGQVRAAQADAAAARLLLSSAITRQYLALARTEAQLDLAERLHADRQALVQLVEARVRAGLDTQMELRTAEGAVPEVRGTLAQLREQRTLILHALAALSAQQHSDLAASHPAAQPVPALHASADTPLVLALDLIGRRPDIAAARARIEVATAEVAHARSQFYPNLSLTAFAGFSSLGITRLLHSDASQWGVGPALRLPLFDANRLRGQLQGTHADLDAAVESYNAQIIEAVHDAADQLASLNALHVQLREQDAGLAQAQAAYLLASQRQRAGLGTMQQVLSADIAVLAQRRQHTDLHFRLLDIQAQLLRALGGIVPAPLSSNLPPAHAS